MSNDAIEKNRQAIQQVVNDWVVYGDSGDWERFAGCWHDDGVMSTTWTQAAVAEFIQGKKIGFEKGANVSHFLGGFSCELSGQRAIAQTKMTIHVRASIHDVLVDVISIGRFYDFFEQRDGRWGLVRRQPIYEKDRMDSVSPMDTLTLAQGLDQELLMGFPEGYRYLAYLQSQMGIAVSPIPMPGLRGKEVERLYRQGRDWLQG